MAKKNGAGFLLGQAKQKPRAASILSLSSVAACEEGRPWTA